MCHSLRAVAAGRRMAALLRRSSDYIRVTVSAEIALLVPPILMVIGIALEHVISPPAVRDVTLPPASRFQASMFGEAAVDLARHVAPKNGSLRTNDVPMRFVATLDMFGRVPEKLR